MRRMAVLLVVAAGLAQAGERARECKLRCTSRLLECEAACGDAYGVPDRQCRRAVLRDCKRRGAAVACPVGSTTTTVPTTTTTTTPCVEEPRTYAAVLRHDSLTALAVGVETRPCVPDIRLRMTAVQGDPFFCKAVLVQGGHQAESVPCLPGYVITPAYRDVAFCWESSDMPQACDRLYETVVADATLRSFPPWFDPRLGYRLTLVTLGTLDVP